MSSRSPSRPRVSQEMGPGATDLLEEAVHRLRLAPVRIVAIYYCGSLPFILGLLYFWTDLSSAPDAARHATGATLGLALLFLWMKVFHAIYAVELRARFGRAPAASWTFARLARLASVQITLQATGLFLLPAAAIVTIPLGWAYAFYQNVTALGDGATGSVKHVFARAGRASLLWPKQNHAALAILSLLGLFAWLNLILAAYIAPHLLRQFTGEENMFTRSGTHLFNTTFFAVTVCLVYLALDPLIKAFYALRCFYGDSLRSGEDLKSELRALPAPSPDAALPAPAPATAAAAPLAVALLLLCLPTSAPAAGNVEPAASPTPSASVSPAALRQSVERVLQRREFTWRLPRGQDDPKKKALSPSSPSFLEDLFRWFREMREAMGRWFADKWEKLFPHKVGENHAAPGYGAGLRRTLYALIAVCVGAILFLVWQSWRQRRARRELAGRVEPAADASVVDLADDNLLATQLPEDEWLGLARSLLQQGERRLAMRAFYLSTLANLGARGLVLIARHKSNRDYLDELRRRARDFDDLHAAFARNVRRFERVWYGPHPASEELLADFLADREIIGAAAVPSPASPPLLAGLPLPAVP